MLFRSLHRGAYDAARDKVVAHCRAEGELTSNFAKELIGGSRKYIIPLLEHFDAIGLTVRSVSSRRLKPGYERLLTAPASSVPPPSPSAPPASV